jgi:low temperature requirement protein LtrA
MRRRTNFAPTARTIIVALVLMIAGLFGATGTVLPTQAGVIAFVAAIVLLLVGMVVPQI